MQDNRNPPPSSDGRRRLELDEAGLRAARSQLDDGAVTPSYGPWREDIVRLLNDALATELVCVLRYKRHHFTAKGLASPAVADEFMVHANEEAAHADRIAERIVQLGGDPDFAPQNLQQRSHADYDDSSDLRSMVRANLVAERIAVEAYLQLIGLIGDKGSDDPPPARGGSGRRGRTRRRDGRSARPLIHPFTPTRRYPC